MIKINPKIMKLSEEEKVYYDNLCKNFYKKSFSSKQAFEEFLEDYNLMLETVKNKDYDDISYLMSDYIQKKCNLSYRARNLKIAMALAKNLNQLYSNNNTFKKLFMCGSDNFVYYIDLNVLLNYMSDNKEQYELIKKEIIALEQKMIKARTVSQSQNDLIF